MYQEFGQELFLALDKDGVYRSEYRMRRKDGSTIFTEHQRRTLSKESPTPMYFQLYTLLKGCIVDGTFGDGTRLPTEKELSDEFSISRITAKRSLDELAAEGLVERRRGKGTHVTFRYQQQPVHAPLTGMLQEIETMALSSKAVLLSCDMLRPPRALREEFEIGEDETLLYLARVRERDGKANDYRLDREYRIKVPVDLEPAGFTWLVVGQSSPVTP